MNCFKCKHADWTITKLGHLHPSGDGMCTYPYQLPELPVAFYWWSDRPNPSGGYINRKKELKRNCIYYAETDK